MTRLRAWLRADDGTYLAVLLGTVALARTKVQIGNSLRFLGQNAVQLHGGIGITDEYVGSHYFKYLTQIEMQFGDTNYNLGVVSAGMKDFVGVAE